jgi:hypothetical protein
MQLSWLWCASCRTIAMGVYPFTRISRGAMPESLFMTNAVERNNDCGIALCK